MKRHLFIILAFLPLFGFGQSYTPIIKSPDGLVVFNSNILLSGNTLEQGLVLKLRASTISEDSLTYNSSGNLVTYANIDTVVLDGSSEVVIGNSVRFGTPTAGTIYQVLDTLGSSDTLILDQTFTGSVTDEYYWGGVGKWYDESGEENNAIQSTAVKQPKLLWYNTDSASVWYDGVDDRLKITNSFNPNADYTWFTEFTSLKLDSELTRRLFSNSLISSGYEIYHNETWITVRYYLPAATGYVLTDVGAVTQMNNYNLAITKESDTLTCYINKKEQLSKTTGTYMNTTNDSYFSGAKTTANVYLNQKCKRIYFYTRKLTQNEINELSK